MKHYQWLLMFLFISCLLLLSNALSEATDIDFNSEGAMRYRIREEQRQTEVGYVYDSLEQEKELIFRQLEIITGDEETRYIIVPGDTLTVSFIDRTKKVGAVYKVSSKGEIHLPLIGAVKIGGLNRRDARALIDEKFREYIRHPNVEVSVNTSGRIMILGEVLQPGLYLIQPNLTVMEAILTAGSYDEEDGNLKSVVLMRGGLDDPVVMRLNLMKLIKEGDRSDDILVKPGDLIYVPKTFVANLNKFKDDVYKWVTTYYGFGRLPAPPQVQPKQPILWDR